MQPDQHQTHQYVQKTTRDNSADAWSSGLAGDGYQFLTTGTDALVTKTTYNAICANLLGDVAGTLKGKALFYKDDYICGKLLVSSDVNIVKSAARAVVNLTNKQYGGLSSIKFNIVNALAVSPSSVYEYAETTSGNKMV